MNIMISILKAALLGLLLAVPPMAMGQFTYTTTDGKVTITGYSGSGGNVAIPDTIDGQPVVAIGQDAFKDCSNITSVTIPNSVTSIGVWAFGRCKILTSVTIPNSVTSIEDGAFFDCPGLVVINVDPLNDHYSSLAGVLFNKSQSLLIQYPCRVGGNYIIPASVTSIGPRAFDRCTNLTRVTIPDSVTSIGHSAFFGCSGLISMTIPASVTNIGNVAFYRCSGLASITIPNSVTSIGVCTFNRCTGLTNVTIPNTVISIGNNAFTLCSGLTSVTIPDSVINIGPGAFSYCSKLQSIFFLGNAPAITWDSPFESSTNVCYYLSGKSGWGDTYGGRPAYLRNPAP